MDAAIAEIADRLAGVERRFETGVAFGGAGPGLADALLATGKVGSAHRVERHPAAYQAGGSGIVADEETLPFATESIDLFVAPLALQWTNDLPGSLVQIRSALRPDGLLLAAMTGGSTLTELRASIAEAEAELWGGASPRVLPTADVRDLGGLLQRAGFALPVADRDVLTVRYDTAFGLFEDLRRMGASNALVERARRPATRGLLARTAEIYGERFSDPDGRVRATFEIISLSGWAPHESQQKPAARGSGAVSLASLLERKT
jgi:SAM-dependent methyltransferase